MKILTGPILSPPKRSRDKEFNKFTSRVLTNELALHNLLTHLNSPEFNPRKAPPLEAFLPWVEIDLPNPIPQWLFDLNADQIVIQLSDNVKC